MLENWQYDGLETLFQDFGDDKIVESTLIQESGRGGFQPHTRQAEVKITPFIRAVSAQEYHTRSLAGGPTISTNEIKKVQTPNRGVLVEYFAAMAGIASAPNQKTKRVIISKLSTDAKKIKSAFGPDVVAFHQVWVVENMSHNETDTYTSRRIFIPGTVSSLSYAESLTTKFNDDCYNARQGIFKIFRDENGVYSSHAFVDICPVVRRTLDGRLMPVAHEKDCIVDPLTAQTVYQFLDIRDGFGNIAPQIRHKFRENGRETEVSGWPEPYNCCWPAPKP